LREIRGEGADAFARGDASRPSPSRDPKLEASARLAVRAKLLESVEAARRRAKREAVLRKLRETSEFKKTVRPRFGELCFFEHPFRNGSASEGVFEIRCDDPDIVLVTSSAERARLRTLASVTDATYDEEDARRNKHLDVRSNAFIDLEDDAFDGNRLFLAAGESARLAFTFQSFERYDLRGSGSSDDSPHLRPRTTVIHFVDTNEGVSVHALVVDVRPRAVSTARTFRFHANENDFWKTEIPVPVPVGAFGAFSGRFSFAARASDPSVAATILDLRDRDGKIDERETDGRTNNRETAQRVAFVSLRAKCGAAAEPNDVFKTFFVNVYGDELLATLLFTWRVTLRVAPKVDVAATVGQTTRASVAVKGIAGRRVTAYTSRPGELRAFLAPSAKKNGLDDAELSELTLAFKPRSVGRSLDVVHLIDDSTGALAHVRLVATDARAPIPSRVFDARVANGAETHKKISYSNPYATRRAFVLRSTHPDLLRFRPEILELAPAGDKGATRFFGMTFDSSEAWTRRRGDGTEAPTEVTVFINDEHDATEECFRVRVFAAEEVG
jgi:nephrocystin-4